MYCNSSPRYILEDLSFPSSVKLGNPVDYSVHSKRFIGEEGRSLFCVCLISVVFGVDNVNHFGAFSCKNLFFTFTIEEEFRSSSVEEQRG